jgi:biuret amidohydrolase
MSNYKFQNAIYAMSVSKTALLIVDMQRYYTEPESSFHRFFNHLTPGCMEYITDRCENIVIPNISRLVSFFKNKNHPVIYFRLCGKKFDRSDLHRFFQSAYLEALDMGFSDIYPLESSPMADVVDAIKPGIGDIIFNKTTFSAFTSSSIEPYLKEKSITQLIFTGLATSQCVETTARDASDRGYEIIHAEDAQADYDETTHNASLYASRGVCGGGIMLTDDIIKTKIL